MPQPSRLVVAAGTVVTRGAGKSREVLVIHRALRNDWSLPKGKQEPGELLPVTAVRETLEETTVQVVLRQPVASIEYKSLGNPKLVRYWLADVADPLIASREHDYADDWQPNEEVDQIVWLRVPKAMNLLSYKQDREVLERALALRENTSPFILLRHAEAEKRADFAARHDGPTPHDHERPLTSVGTAAITGLAEMLKAYGISAAFTSPALRCRATLADFVDSERLVQVAEISEFAHDDNALLTARRTLDLYEHPVPTVVACHRPVLPTMVRAIANHTGTPEPSPKLKPGQFLVFHRPVSGSGRIRVSPAITEHSADQEF